MAKSFFTKDKIVQHHIDSYNKFLETGLQKIIDEQKIIETDLEDTYIKLGKIRVENPIVKEADGAIEKLYPNEARLRNLSYSAPLYLQMSVVEGEEEKEPQEAKIGQLPVMIKSNICNLQDLTDEEMVKYGEDPLDPGGYFIVNGTERVVMTLEDLAPNKILTEFGERYGDTIEVSKVFSQRRGYRALVVVERGRKSLLEVSFPSISGRVNFITLMRALGVETDEDLVKIVSTDPEIMKFMFENLEEAEVDTIEEAMEKIGSRVASGQARDYQIKRANYVIDRYLLPHLGNEPSNRVAKANFLGRMAESCFELALAKRNEDDKDHYSNKRLKLTGDLMEDLFRVAFNRLSRDVKYQLERANMRNRELNVITLVRADVLTDRLQHPLATGNWVGGRTGVSQLLDRTDYISTLSHLRRVISPLSRAQPHFEARDLHPTQWGRLCPSETPEGPNCGLVKNFAQMVELSTGTDDNNVIKNILHDLNVVPTTLRSATMKVPGYEEELGDYIEELESIPHTENESTEAIGYTSYSDTLDDSIGGNPDE
ncbi:DNA-directed RNA polymerase subunit B'' [Methanolobus halotolerans]|uniref:DNA-directed RNA polymerase n=1 Tax=Methanolobus halotolerans TaxID=2052935 RepID=A0A4E0Q8P3_9EURY|nr:DNA-directed RNA polymerase subunit B'' [Methanolobus halotolerans]TGC11344.1 DNA-directed RNA polymerase subunit B'' [Methanolobus halotolerans]